MDLFIAFAGGFIAAFIGSMAGGGAGFFGLYALLFLGLPLNIGIATNKFGDIGFFPLSLRNFARQGFIKKKIFVSLLLLEAIGATAGTFLLIRLNENAIKIIVTLVIIPAFFLLAFQGSNYKTGKENPLWRPIYLFSSIYFNLIGAGGGFIRMFALMGLRKLPALQAAANGFAATFPFNLLSVGVLVYAGRVNIRLGIPILIGNLIGAHFGSKIAIQKGNAFVRYMLLFLTIVTLIVVWIR
jgi:uncharacterized membrane protein YfcA